jgi:D-arabinose 1-dehydrogenase-like Zn-dependent alcohol dehydrogenase
MIGTRGGRFIDLVKTVRFVAEGRIKSVVTDLYPMEQANKALALLREGKAMGRVVLLTPAGSKPV